MWEPALKSQKVDWEESFAQSRWNLRSKPKNLTGKTMGKIKMKRAKIQFTYAMLCIISTTVMLCGCGKTSANEEGKPDDGSSVIREELEEWPDIDYTRAIIKPVTGTMDYVLYDEEEGYYAVFLKNITLEDGKQYIQLLQKNGFETVSSDSNFVATGELLQKKNVVVSVSASENVLALYISLNAEKYTDN